MILAWFSCGVTSAVACKLAIMEHGADNVRLVYFKIDSAHPDNARFIADCERWYGKEIEFARSTKYKDQFDVISKRRYINGPNGAPCTGELKKKVRERVEKDGFSHQVFGFEYEPKEINRAIRLNQQHPHTNPIFPLIEQKLTKAQCADILLKNGIDLPAMYHLGYHNNNCIGCVKGGQGYWNKIRQDFPETFLKMAKIERELGRSCLKQPDGKPKKIKQKNGSIKKVQKYKPFFLDELNPESGRHEPPILPDCGTFCEIEFAHIIDPQVKAIMDSPLQAGKQLKLF